MRVYLNKLITCFILVSLFACGGGNQALISQAEIDSAQQSGRLPSLYDKAAGMVTENRGSAKKEAIALRSKIAQLLVDEKNASVNKLLAQHTQDQTSVNRASLLDLKASIVGMETWSATEYARTLPKVDKAINKVNTLIGEAVAESKEEGKDQVASVLALKRAAELAGAGQPEAVQYEKANQDALTQLMYQGNDGLTKRLYNTVITSAKSGLMLDPGNVQFESMLSQGQAGLFEKDFRFALENGKPESAYQSMLTVADTPIFLQLKKSMSKSILLLANYFAGSAKKAYQGGDLLTAYNSFIKGRTIQQKLGVSKSGFIHEKRFLDQLMTQVKSGNLSEGRRQTLMRIVREFDANYPGLDSEYLKSADIVKKRAMTKLSIAEFKEVPSPNSVIASVGRRVGSKLEKILFDRLGTKF